MKSAIITYSLFQDQELIYPYYRLAGEFGSSNVAVYSDAGLGIVRGIHGIGVPSTHDLDVLNKPGARAEMIESSEILIIPGGVKSMEKLRQHEGVLSTVREYLSTGKTLGVICSGSQVLISAGVLAGKKISAYYAMEVDIINAGAVYDPSPVVFCGNIVSSPHYKYVGEWMNGVLKNASA